MAQTSEAQDEQSPGKLEQPLKKPLGQLQREPLLASPVWQVGIGAIDIAEGRGLDDQQVRSLLRAVALKSRMSVIS